MRKYHWRTRKSWVLWGAFGVVGRRRQGARTNGARLGTTETMRRRGRRPQISTDESWIVCKNVLQCALTAYE